MRWRSAAALAAGTWLANHAGPALTHHWWLARRWNPALCGIGEPNHVALTFDDGPSPATTPRILAELERLDVRATFFLLGSEVERYPWAARAVAEAGHEIAVHGHWHRNHLVRSVRAVRYDLARALDAIGTHTGQRPAWFRPPYGVVSRGTRVAAHEQGLRLVLWSSWGRDWRAHATPTSVLADLTHRLHGGATLLLHDSDATSAPGSPLVTLATLEDLVARVRAQGWRIGPLGEHGA